MADFITSERDGGLQYIADLAAVRRQLFGKALEHDGMATDTVIAVFSDGNPFVVFLDRVSCQYVEAVQNFACLGYTGLSMQEGRSTLYKRKRVARKRP